MAAFEENHTKLFNYRQISGRLGMETVEDRHLVADLLASLAKEGVLAEPEEGRYRYNVRSLSFEGIFDRRNNGRHFVNPVDGAAPVPVDEVNSGHAFKVIKCLSSFLQNGAVRKSVRGRWLRFWSVQTPLLSVVWICMTTSLFSMWRVAIWAWIYLFPAIRLIMHVTAIKSSFVSTSGRRAAAAYRGGYGGLGRSR